MLSFTSGCWLRNVETGSRREIQMGQGEEGGIERVVIWEYGRRWSCAILPVTQREMFAAISIGQILAVLVTLDLIGLSIAAFIILRRK